MQVLWQTSDTPQAPAETYINRFHEFSPRDTGTVCCAATREPVAIGDAGETLERS
jgi:hypothetical protein